MTEARTHVLEVRVKGALLLGAGRARERHDATLRRPGGEPYIPASALKGAIREQLVRLRDEARATAILGGRGLRQDDEATEASATPEVAERIGGGLTRVYLGDAELDPAERARFGHGLGYTVRAQVAIDRQGRRAADRRLYQREVVGSRGQDLLFRAPVDARLLAGEELRHFEAAVRAVFALGSSRSRGLGWVDLELKPAGASEPAPVAKPGASEASELEVVFEAREPLSLGALPFVGNFQPTLDYLPASTVRGAVVTAAMQHRGITANQSEDPAFRALLLDPDTCVRFGDAIPAGHASGPPPRIAPLTVRIGKYGKEKAGISDRLIRDFLQCRLAERGVFLGLPDEVERPGGVRERAVRARRWVYAGSPERRVMTRLALDRESARGRDGALYSVELLERGSRFVATVANAGAEAWALLGDAAAGGLRAGHGRGQGYGGLSIVEIRANSPSPLGERLEAFDAYLRQQLARWQKAATEPLATDEGRYFAVLLVTELLPEKSARSESAETAFHAALGLAGSRLLHAEVRAAQRGGFDTTAGRPLSFEPVVAAGSVLLLTVPDFDAAILARLQALERHGAGRCRERGFGAVRFSDPIHLEGGSA
jgi:CRISPR-associated protein Csx10